MKRDSMGILSGGDLWGKMLSEGGYFASHCVRDS